MPKQMIGIKKGYIFVLAAMRTVLVAAGVIGERKRNGNDETDF
jgi:hypothetical protein